jgi:hypothetical protein
VETDFMQQRAEGAFFKNMVAFEKIGDAMDLASLA